MKKILICNQKGGVGKSLIADEIAFSFERSNIPTAFLDLDSQGGTVHKTDKRSDAKVAIIDTPGALQVKMGEWMTAADVIIIPTRTTSRDIEPLLRMLEIVRENTQETPVVIVMNGWNRWRASSDFLSWFNNRNKTYIRSKKIVICKLPQSEQFVRASASGQSVIEYSKYGPIVKATRDLCDLTRKLAGFKPEK